MLKPFRRNAGNVRHDKSQKQGRRNYAQPLRPTGVIAAEGLRRIAQIYAVEAEIRGIDAGQRLSARQVRSAPLVATFGEWLQEQRLRVSAKSRLGEKLGYIHNHWGGLQTFLQDGRVEIDSNSVENMIRPIALNRKTPYSQAMTRAEKPGGASLR